MPWWQKQSFGDRKARRKLALGNRDRVDAAKGTDSGRVSPNATSERFSVFQLRHGKLVRHDSGAGKESRKAGAGPALLLGTPVAERMGTGRWSLGRASPEEGSGSREGSQA